MRVVERDWRIDSLRFVGMVAVVLFHIGVLRWGNVLMFPDSFADFIDYWRQTDWALSYFFMVMGDQAVPLFIFLSGYGLVFSSKKPSLNWLGRRLMSVLLPFWMAFVLVFLVWWCWEAAPGFMAQYTVAQPVTWLRILFAAGLFQNASLYTFNSPVPSWWFIPILVQLYFLYPLLHRLLVSLSAKGYLKLLFIFQGLWNAGVILQLWLIPSVLWFWYSGFSYVLVFGLGMWWAKYAPIENVTRPGQQTIGLLLGLLVWISGFSLRMLGSRNIQYAEVLIAMGWFICGWWGLLLVARMFPHLVKGMSWVGRRLSYGVYLGHEAVLYWVGAIVWMWGR